MKLVKINANKPKGNALGGAYGKLSPASQAELRAMGALNRGSYKQLKALAVMMLAMEKASGVVTPRKPAKKGP